MKRNNSNIHPFTLAGFGVFDVAKLQLFLDRERKNPANQKASRNGDEEMSG